MLYAQAAQVVCSLLLIWYVQGLCCVH